jgi:hypothetical protein
MVLVWFWYGLYFSHGLGMGFSMVFAVIPQDMKEDDPPELVPTEDDSDKAAVAVSESSEEEGEEKVSAKLAAMRQLIQELETSLEHKRKKAKREDTESDANSVMQEPEKVEPKDKSECTSLASKLQKGGSVDSLASETEPEFVKEGWTPSPGSVSLAKLSTDPPFCSFEARLVHSDLSLGSTFSGSCMTLFASLSVSSLFAFFLLCSNEVSNS